jgi:hypothetical protein
MGDAFGLNDTFDLSDNPFDPVLPGLGRRIAGDAMPLDRYPDLIEKLLCTDVAGLKQAEQKLRAVLFNSDTSTGDEVQNAILLIHGVRGSGRTTLANLVRSWFVGPAGRAAEQWQPCDLPFDAYLPLPRPEEIRDKFDDQRTRLAKLVQNGAKRVVVVIDNLPRGYFDFVVSVYKSADALQRVFIVTTDDTELVDSDLDAYDPVIEWVRLTKLSSAEVHVFIDERVRRYRSGRIALIQSDPDFALFPFARSAPETVVSGGSKPLRNVQHWLRRQIVDRHNALVGQGAPANIAGLPPEDLRARMIP